MHMFKCLHFEGKVSNCSIKVSKGAKSFELWRFTDMTNMPILSKAFSAKAVVAVDRLLKVLSMHIQKPY